MTAMEGSWETRAAQLVDVRHPERIIELVVMPYNEPALVPHEGRMIREICMPGAWDGIQTRPGRVKVNRDHDLQRSVGKAVTFHPSREEGLIAEIRISATELGDETLTLAADGVLDASAGFRPMPGGESWHERRSLRRITKAWLGHIALCPDPAYDGARVLAVRSALDELAPAPAMPLPNLDVLRERELVARYLQLDAKYGLGASDGTVR